jgi:Chaperone of endosialidase
MKIKLNLLTILLLVSAACGRFSTALAQGTAFTYQGRLNSSGSPVNGKYDLTFSLLDAGTNGNLIAGPLTNSAVVVSNSLFTTTLDFGTSFPGASVVDRWLQIGVRTNGTGAFQPLTPRQEVTPTPYAITANYLASVIALNTVGGGYATVAGGDANNSSGGYSFIGGGNLNTSSGQYAVVDGGLGNSSSSEYATVGGGGYNISTNMGATVGGGYINLANANYATIGGGEYNIADGLSSTISGGVDNTNNGNFATICGGANNTCNGFGSTVAGGDANTANGSYSFAAGNSALAEYDGSFVWSDDSGTPTSSSHANQFVARASGGFAFYTSSGSGGAQLAANATAWSILSDRNAKKNIQPADCRAVLDKLAQVPIDQWYYKWENDSGTPNLGPMAQDFKHAFFPGRDDKTISTLEFDGVELAAIQGLNQKLNEKDGEIQQLQNQNQSLAKRLAELEHAVQSLTEKK